jgi:hypothetical protein
VKVNFTIPQKILLFPALIETTFYSVGEYEFMREELKKINNIERNISLYGPYRNISLYEKYFSIRTERNISLYGPYREIFLLVLKTSLGLRPRAVFKTSRNISLYGPPIR